MQGNVYVIVPSDHYDSLVPQPLSDLFGFYGFESYDEFGNPIGDPIPIHPTWAQAAERLTPIFGEPIYITYNSADYMIMELELSHINGEAASVVALQSAEKPAWFKFATNTEAIKLINGEDIFA